MEFEPAKVENVNAKRDDDHYLCEILGVHIAGHTEWYHEQVAEHGAYERNLHRIDEQRLEIDPRTLHENVKAGLYNKTDRVAQYDHFEHHPGLHTTYCTLVIFVSDSVNILTYITSIVLGRWVQVGALAVVLQMILVALLGAVLIHQPVVVDSFQVNIHAVENVVNNVKEKVKVEP